MTATLGAVEVEVRANLLPMQAGFAKAEAEAKALGTAAGRAVQQGFGGAAVSAGRSIQAVQADMTNLRFQINDVATGLLSGGSPFMVLSQQAGQFSQILDRQSGGIRGAVGMIGQAFMSMLNPINLGIAAIGVAAYAATSFFSDTEEGADVATAAIKKHEEAIKNLRGAWGEAAKGLMDYLDMSPVVAEADFARSTKATGDAIRTEIGGAIDQINEALAYAQNNVDAVIPDREQFDAVVAAAQQLRDEYESGIIPNVIEFRELMDAVRLNPNASQDVIDIIDLLVGATDRAYDLARALGSAQAAGQQAIQGRFDNLPDFPKSNFMDRAPRPGINPSRDLTSDYGVPSRRGGGGGGGRDPFAAGMERAAERLRSLEQEKVAVGLSGEALARYRAEMQFLNSVQGEWNKLTEDQRAALQDQASKIGDAAAQVENLREKQRELKDAQQEAEDAMAAVGQAAENLFMGIMQGGDAAKMAIAQLVAELLRAAILGDGPLSALFGGGLLGGAAGGASAAAGASAIPRGGRPIALRQPGTRAVSGGNTMATSIVINGGAGADTVAQLRTELKRRDREMMRQLDERERNAWRVN
jgi:hypothetical protein